MVTEATSEITVRSKTKERKSIGVDVNETENTKGKEWSDDARPHVG